MKKLLSPDDLARDDRFTRVPISAQFDDKRRSTREEDADGGGARNLRRMVPDAPGASDAARSLMHGIFVGEIQALEGAGRTCFDFEVGSAADEVPFELKLDMARQCWDESRHCEISIKLSAWMGTELGEFAESAFLFQAACNPDPVLRLTGVNRALEGLAIDVFNTMREFGRTAGDPVLEFCEDWMLADEVTHVKMGSDWLRKVTVNDPERQKQALDFQRTVDKLFSFGGFRGEDDESPVKLARHFRNLAGFSEAEISDLVDVAHEAMAEAQAMAQAARGAIEES